MAKAPAAPVPYTRGPQPLLPGGEDAYVQNELNTVSTAINTTAQFAVFSAKKAPPVPVDGMVRLSRDPWRPVSGQTTDQWVYYDAAGGVWRLLGTAPTNT